MNADDHTRYNWNRCTKARGDMHNLPSSALFHPTTDGTTHSTMHVPIIAAVANDSGGAIACPGFPKQNAVRRSWTSKGGTGPSYYLQLFKFRRAVTAVVSYCRSSEINRSITLLYGYSNGKEQGTWWHDDTCKACRRNGSKSKTR